MSNEGTHDPTLDRGRNGGVAPGDLPEGMEVGEYRVQRKIGEGGMGTVYAAIQPVIGKRVAIKVIAPQIASNPDVVRRFVDEARAVNKIGHPNIVDIFSFGWLPDRRHYFAMEFLDGHSLSDRLKQGPLPAAECRRILRQICEALEAAHRQGIVHRDLKPDNIWIAEPQHGESFAKLLDFGIAKLMGEGDAAKRTQTGVMMGTPAYMSPEQCRGEGIDRATDIYALGTILYEMFARRLPFTGGFAELITHHLLTAPKPPSTHAPVSPELEKVILSCLQKDPKLRPPSAEALGRLLEAALPTGEGAAAPATALLAPLVPPPAPASGAVSVEVQPDTLSPAPGRTTPPLTQLPVRDRRPLFVLAGMGAVAVVAALAMATGKRGGGDTAPPQPVQRPVPQAAAAPRPPTGNVRVMVKGADSATVTVDGKLIAAGVREARVPNVAAGEPHHLRVEAPGHTAFERTFTVAADAEIELDVALPPVAPPPSENPSGPRPAAERVRSGGERTHHRDTSSPGTPTTPAAASSKRHRDGLVGDDIFDAPRAK